MAKAATAKKATADTSEQAVDRPLLDLNNDAVKKMIRAAKKCGYVTVDQLNSVMLQHSGQVHNHVWYNHNHQHNLSCNRPSAQTATGMPTTTTTTHACHTHTRNQTMCLTVNKQ